MNEYFKFFLYLKSSSAAVTGVGRSLEIIVMRGNCTDVIKVIIQGSFGIINSVPLENPLLKLTISNYWYFKLFVKCLHLHMQRFNCLGLDFNSFSGI